MDGMTYTTLLALALLALAGQEPGASPDARAHADAALHAGTLYRLDPALLVALAWEESRGRSDLVSPRGACGATQVLPKYVPDVSCADLQRLDVAYAVGAWALTRWREHCPVDPLACYNGGNAPGRASLAYARRVRARARWIGAWMRRAEEVTQ